MRRHTIIIAALLASSASPARAQCTSNASSCVSCHETRGMRPVLSALEPWHRDHAFGDLCSSCHAGQPGDSLEQGAHRGLRDPLADPISVCVPCHERDADALAFAYVQWQGIGTAVDGARGSPATQAASSQLAGSAGTSNTILVLLIAALALPLLVLGRRRLDASSACRALVAALRAKTWSPYTAGAALGLLVAFCEVVLRRPLGVAGAFDKLAAYLGRVWFPSSQYYAHVMPPAITWQVWLVLGLFGGSWLASKFSSELRVRWVPDEQWTEHFGTRRIKRLAIALLGAALVQFGADIAGGCTSGLAISGGAVLSPAAFLFIAGMFAGGIPTAWAWSRVGRRP